MPPPRGFPLAVETLVVPHVEGQDGAAPGRRIGVLLLVRESAIVSPGFLATLRVVAAMPQDLSEPWVNLLIGVEPDP